MRISELSVQSEEDYWGAGLSELPAGRTLTFWANFDFLLLNFDFLLVVRELTFLHEFLSVGAHLSTRTRSNLIVSNFGVLWSRVPQWVPGKFRRSSRDRPKSPKSSKIIKTHQNSPKLGEKIRVSKKSRFEVE